MQNIFGDASNFTIVKFLVFVLISLPAVYINIKNGTVENSSNLLILIVGFVFLLLEIGLNRINFEIYNSAYVLASAFFFSVITFWQLEKVKAEEVPLVHPLVPAAIVVLLFVIGLTLMVVECFRNPDALQWSNASFPLAMSLVLLFFGIAGTIPGGCAKFLIALLVWFSFQEYLTVFIVGNILVGLGGIINSMLPMSKRAESVRFVAPLCLAAWFVLMP